MLLRRFAVSSDPHSQQVGQVTLVDRAGLFLRWDRCRSSRFNNRSGGRYCRSWSHSTSGCATVGVATAGRATGACATVAAAIDDFITTQAKSLFGLADDTAIAVTKRTCQGGDDFGAAAAMNANLIANLVGCRTANMLISIIQSVDESRHDLWVADAIITITELPERRTSLTSVAGRLRGIDQLGDVTSIRVAALRIDRSAVRYTRSATVRTGGSARSSTAMLAEQAFQKATAQPARFRAAGRSRSTTRRWAAA